ncbi:hypothetical protein P691DRAFT_784564 [Macrolepiota fuliginosa MF-IS2]|uniref:Nephrocystin 3-like N-terminal domain-containing protein n=1 Tax=Macrolepiota fuliginosa MF-IS2 TaxID=1400762 RepID=A0A9P5X7L7_9AGAR|nr:hypothetical protein P691DRAFT_784564 [Macrolepiota fuliginosa MF-IS2]
MDVDWCLCCGKSVHFPLKKPLQESNDIYCSPECRYHDGAATHSGATSGAERANQSYLGVPAWASKKAHSADQLADIGPLHPNIQVFVNHSSSVIPPPKTHYTTHRAPNLIQPSRPISPSLTLSQPECSASAPVQSTLTSRELLSTISPSRSPDSPTNVRATSASWPASYIPSSILSMARRNSHARGSVVPGEASGSGTLGQRVAEPGSLSRLPSQTTMASATPAPSPSSTLVGASPPIPGVSSPMSPPKLSSQSPEVASQGEVQRFLPSVIPLSEPNICITMDISMYIMPGAELDSRLREYPPRCHPGTRTEILTSIRTSLHNIGQESRLIWLSGPAGAGKSAVMQTLAETESQNLLCAALFLSRTEKINEARRVLPTIAYQLAVRNNNYLSFLEERFRNDPMFLERSLAAQFQSLIVTPFVHKRVPLESTSCAIFVDALDECVDERDQIKLIELVSGSVAEHPTTPIKWIFATRQKRHFKTIFSRVKARISSYQEYHLSFRSTQARGDVERFLHGEFSRIRDGAMCSSLSPWPTNEQLRRITTSSAGFFAFASAVVHFVDKPTGDPYMRLRCILAFFDDVGSKTLNCNTENPFKSLDMLYSQIMSDTPLDLLPKIKLLLGYCLFSKEPDSSRESLSLVFNILGLDSRVEDALWTLSSVLVIPSPLSMQTRRPQFLHTSFSDYLRDPSRSDTYWVNMNSILTELWRCYTRIILQWLEYRSSDETQFKTQKRDAQAGIVALVGVAPPMNFGSPMFIDEDSIDFLNFLVWIRDHTPVELRNKLVLQQFNWKRMDKPRLFKALCERKWYRTIIEGSQRFSVEVDDKWVACIKDLHSSEWVAVERLLAKTSGKLGELTVVG